MFRRFLVILILGLIVGLGIGVGYAAWRKQGFSSLFSTKSTLLGDLAVECSGGTKPVILVTWTATLNPVIGGLERSVASGSWRTIGAPTQASGTGQTHVTDEDVQPGVTYAYRVVSNGDVVASIVSLTADEATCTPK